MMIVVIMLRQRASLVRRTPNPPLLSRFPVQLGLASKETHTLSVLTSFFDRTTEGASVM